ncbi:MAG: hypothetical protein R3F39_05865 [Myxococcota bacterium]
MNTQPSFYEDSVFELLTEVSPENLEARRILALKMVGRISPHRLRRLLSPTLACALLDAMRLGGLEVEAEQYTPESYAQLIEVRRVISEIAHSGGRRFGVASVYARGAHWEPIFLALAPCPTPMTSPGTIVIDDALHRVDGPAAQLRAALAQVGCGANEIRIARTRFDANSDDLPAGASLAAEIALLIARRNRPRPLPRFAAVGAGDAPADLKSVPADIRVVFVARGAAVPLGAETWAEIDGPPVERTLTWLREGGHACIYVDSADEAVAILLRLNGDTDLATHSSPRSADFSRAGTSVSLATLWGAMVSATADSRHG